jgi:hypothetical protein
MEEKVYPWETVYIRQTNKIGMKIGLILECQPGGADATVYPYVIKRICKKLNIQKAETLIQKKRLINEGPVVAQGLIEIDKCDYVFFIWDRKPRWEDRLGNCQTDSNKIATSLQGLGVDMNKIVLCCIDEELESWLISDSRGFMEWIRSKTTHPLPEIGDHKKKAEQCSPKNKIKNYLNNHYPTWKYDDIKDNVKIVECFPDFDRAAKWNKSFGYLKKRVETICPE